jgi:outer membrane protein OmpA-like peptidoglycan-associated protein
MKQLIFISLSIFLMIGCCTKKQTTPLLVDEPPVIVKKITPVDIPDIKMGDLEPIAVEIITINETVYFEFDQSNLRASEQPALDRVVNKLKKRPDVVLILTGACCPIGTDAYNYRLGLRRTKEPYVYLKQRIPNEILCRSFGENNLAARGKSQYFKNRRCIIKAE